MFELKKEKIFRQGFCYDCFLFECGSGELDHEAGAGSTAHLGIQDDLYEEKCNCSPYCLLALSSEVKVGVTRKHRCLHDGLIKVPSRPFQ
jgi:hypothetical protein